MNQTQSQSGILKGWREAKLFYMLSAFAFAALLLYVALIGRTIFTLVEDKQLEAENKSFATDISELELQTLALNDSISIEKAYAMGFVSGKSAEYVASALVLSKR